MSGGFIAPDETLIHFAHGAYSDKLGKFLPAIGIIDEEYPRLKYVREHAEFAAAAEAIPGEAVQLLAVSKRNILEEVLPFAQSVVAIYALSPFAVQAQFAATGFFTGPRTILTRRHVKDAHAAGTRFYVMMDKHTGTIERVAELDELEKLVEVAVDRTNDLLFLKIADRTVAHPSFIPPEDFVGPIAIGRVIAVIAVNGWPNTGELQLSMSALAGQFNLERLDLESYEVQEIFLPLRFSVAIGNLQGVNGREGLVNSTSCEGASGGLCLTLADNKWLPVGNMLGGSLARTNNNRITLLHGCAHPDTISPSGSVTNLSAFGA